MVKNSLIVDSEKPKECFKCGAKIGFVKLKSGKFVPVEVHYESCKGYTADIHLGNHHNSVPVHRCKMAKCKACNKECYERKMLGCGYSSLYCSIECYNKPILEEIKRREDMKKEYLLMGEEQQKQIISFTRLWGNELNDLKKTLK